MKKIRSFLEYIAAFLLIFALLSVVVSVVIVKFYGDDVQEFTMDLLNDQLDTKISIDEMGISIFRKFPNASVFFNDVTVWSGHKFKRASFTEVSPDTLFTADRLYLQFNLLDMLRKRFTVKSLEAREGSLRILIDADGNGNFLLGDRDNQSASTARVEMKGVSVRKMEVQYINLAKEISSGVMLQEMILEGNFGNQEYMLKARGDAFVNNIINHGVNYLSEQDVSTDLFLEVNSNHFQITRGKVMLGELAAAINGEFIIDKNIGADLDLHFFGNKIDIEWVSDILSNSKRSPGISGKGTVNLSVDVKGLLSSTLTPNISASFSTKNASLKMDKPSIDLYDLSVEGTYTNGSLMNVRSTIIQLNSFYLKSGKSNVTGSILLKDLLDPSFNLTMDGTLQASDLDKYINNLPFRTGKGILRPNLRITGTISDLSTKEKNISFQPEGSVGIENIDFLLKGSDLIINDISGNITMDAARMDASLNGHMNDTDLEATLTLKNPLSSFTANPFFTLYGSLYGSNLDIDQLLKNLKKNNKSNQQKSFPQNLDLNLNFKFDQITKGDVETKQVTGTVVYKYPGLLVDPLHMETMNGSISTTLALFDLDQPVHHVSMSNNFTHVEISDLFQSMNNFGQDYLTYENIKGSISGKSDILASINQDFTVNTKDIVSENSFTIKEGELINFKPLVELSRFLKIDEMDHVRFSTISNTILINNNIIDIPNMDIRSSALNLQASGTHSFDKTYEYHLATRLSELLFNKAKSNTDNEFNIALDQEDQRTIFLILFDEGDGMLIEFDEDQAMKKIREDLRNERSELKGILQEEWGIFNKEKDPEEQPLEKQKPVFRFDFSEDEPGDTIPSEKEKRKWWQRNKEPDKKPEFEFVIDDNDP